MTESVARLGVLSWRGLSSIANPSQLITGNLTLYYVAKNICNIAMFLISQLEKESQLFKGWSMPKVEMKSIAVGEKGKKSIFEFVSL